MIDSKGALNKVIANQQCLHDLEAMTMVRKIGYFTSFWIRSFPGIWLDGRQEIIHEFSGK